MADKVTVLKPTPGVVTSGKTELPQILTARDIEEFLGISHGQVSKLLHGRFRGPRLKHARAGRRIIIRRQWLEAWMEESARYEGNKE